MVNMSRLTWPVERRKDFVRIVAYVAITTALIFVADIITPLGIVVWILYLIPLFLTVYLELEICTSRDDRYFYSPDGGKSFPVPPRHIDRICDP